MYQFLQKISFTLFFNLLILSLYCQVNIHQEFYPTEINKDQFTSLKIVIENSNGLQHVTPPSLKNFIVLSGPNQENGMSSVNGNVKQYTALSYVLKPKQTGKIVIDAATILIGGKEYKTNATTLKVNNTSTKGAAGNATAGNLFPNINPFAEARPSSDFKDYILHKGENIQDKVNKNMQLRLETDKTTCYVGEPVSAVYKLYTRLKSESRLTENPSFNGFSVIDLTNPDISGFSRQKLNGREYNVYTIRRAQLYPLQAGNIELESAVLENNIQFIREEYADQHNSDVYGLFDAFNGALMPAEGMINQTVSLKNKPVNIVVKPLPEENKPASFNGAVGSFSIESQLQKTSFPLNESGKLIVKISGSGNMQLLIAAQLEWPKGIDPFDPTVTEELDKTAIPVKGSKTFVYNFSANKTGHYILPAIHFSYFNPESATYKTVSTKDIAFDVINATGPVAFASQSLHKKEPVTGINKIFNNRWWIIAFIAICMFTGIFIWIRKDKKALEEIKVAEKSKPADLILLDSIIESTVVNQKNPLLKTEECLYQEDCAAFYSLLNTELKKFLSLKLGTGTSEINTRNIAEVMDKRNFSNETALQLQHILQEIEWELYTPFERNDTMAALYQKSQDIIQLMNTYDIRRP